MKKLTFIVLAIALSVVVLHSCNEPFTEELVGDGLSLKSASVAKSYIVVLNDAELDVELANQKGYEAKQKVAKSAAEKIMKRAGITDGKIEHVYGTAIKGFAVKITPGQLKKLQDDSSVKYIEEDQIITLVKPQVKPNKPGKYKTHPPAGNASDQTTPWGVTRVNGVSSYSGANKAWILDSGIDLDHPDLNVDVTYSKSFIGEIESSTDDYNGHGTHVAGIIAAKNNDFGVVGVAPGAQVVALKVVNMEGVGSATTIIAALDYIATENVGSVNDLVNMSLGSSERLTYNLLDEAVIAVANKGIKIVISAGNKNDDASYYSPASVNHPNVYTISAMDKYDNFEISSNYGSSVDFCEPGVDIYSCFKDGGYAILSGTSMAAPHMSGLLLLGNIRTDGTVVGDKDNTPDPIGVH